MLHAIGIDIGGTNIKYGLADSSGNIGYESIRPTHQPQTTVYENILDIITEVSRASNSVPETIGIGVPAIIEDGIVTGCFTNLPDLDGMPLAARLGAATGARIAVGNDANLMGLAEWRYGAARGATDALFLTIGTGIGGAMVVNGEQYSGYRNRGSELGHIIVESQGNPCGCGGRGCLGSARLRQSAHRRL
ncbi:ROK family protein [Puia sp. P3]|uniref:ROK family protein n=1 Tax=Puia sp. P3 TaxID=3423952 RepID=UPI003D663D87